MINDKNTDLLYLADSLPKKYPKFYSKFEKLLKENKVNFLLLPETKDVWCRDYMPIQNSLGQFIKFKYQPDYLQSKKYRETITDVNEVCRSLNIQTTDNSLIVDGGNIVHYGNKVIMCDKVLKENKSISQKNLVENLRWALRVNHVILIPTPPNDIFGHADGILRLLDQRTALVNDFSEEDPAYRKVLLKALEKAKIKAIEIPYNPFNNKRVIQANGIYVNYLQMKNVIFLPVFNLKEDEISLRLFSKLFLKEKIIPVECNEIANDGGVLNCISWNIKSNHPKEPELTEYEKEVERDWLCLGLGVDYDFEKPSPYPDDFREILRDSTVNLKR